MTAKMTPQDHTSACLAYWRSSTSGTMNWRVPAQVVKRSPSCLWVHGMGAQGMGCKRLG